MDTDTDVIVSWLPLFHDMGMTGFLVVPMYFGAELVKITPMDFLRDTLLWARLIDKYKGTMTAAPNFAYALFAKRLRRQAKPGEFDLSSLRWALSGAEQVEPADVEDLSTRAAVRSAAGSDPARLRHGRNHRRGVVLRMRRRAGGRRGGHRPARGAAPRGAGEQRQDHRLATLGPLLAGLEARVVDEFGNVVPARGVGVIEVRGDPVTRGYVTAAASSPPRTNRAGTTPATWATSPRKVTSWSAGGSRTSSSWPAAASIRPTSSGPQAASSECDRDARSPSGWTRAQSRESFAVAVESNAYEDTDEVRRIKRRVAHEVVAEVDMRPRNVAVLAPGVIPKTPSGKLRRAYSLLLLN